MTTACQATRLKQDAHTFSGHAYETNFQHCSCQIAFCAVREKNKIGSANLKSRLQINTSLHPQQLALIFASIATHRHTIHFKYTRTILGKGQTLHLYTRPQYRNNNCALQMTLKAVQREQPTTWRLIHKGLPSNNSSITSFAMKGCSPKMRKNNVASRADVHPSTVQSELTQESEVQRKFRGPILRQQNKLCLERRNF